jgi:hypothetical protein
LSSHCWAVETALLFPKTFPFRFIALKWFFICLSLMWNRGENKWLTYHLFLDCLKTLWIAMVIQSVLINDPVSCGYNIALVTDEWINTEFG